MVRHILRSFERAAILQEDRVPRAPECVIANRPGQPGVAAALLNDPQNVAAGEGRASYPV